MKIKLWQGLAAVSILISSILSAIAADNFNTLDSAATRNYTVTPTFAATTAGQCVEQSVSVPGVTTNDVAYITPTVGPPGAAAAGISIPNIRIISNGVIGFWVCNDNNLTNGTPTSQLYVIRATKYK